MHYRDTAGTVLVFEIWFLKSFRIACISLRFHAPFTQPATDAYRYLGDLGLFREKWGGGGGGGGGVAGRFFFFFEWLGEKVWHKIKNFLI